MDEKMIAKLKDVEKQTLVDIMAMCVEVISETDTNPEEVFQELKYFVDNEEVSEEQLKLIIEYEFSVTPSWSDNNS